GVGIAVPKIGYASAPHGVRTAAPRVLVEKGEGVGLGRADVAVVAVAVGVNIDCHDTDHGDLASERVAVAGDRPAVVRDLEPVRAEDVIACQKRGAKGDVGVGADGAAADCCELEGRVVWHVAGCRPGQKQRCEDNERRKYPLNYASSSLAPV